MAPRDSAPSYPSEGAEEARERGGPEEQETRKARGLENTRERWGVRGARPSRERVPNVHERRGEHKRHTQKHEESYSVHEEHKRPGTIQWLTA